MKCPHCGSLNNDDSKFCKNCGNSINKGSLAFQDKFGNKNESKNSEESSKVNQNVLIICITFIICVVIVAGALMYMNNHNDGSDVPIVNNTTDTVEDNDNQTINETSGSWNLIGNFSGHGTGLKYYTLPQGKIKVNISAYPIANYDDNWLIVSSSAGDSVSVDWNSKSSVVTKSDSLTFYSTGKDTLCVDYMELVSWNVEIYQCS